MIELNFYIRISIYYKEGSKGIKEKQKNIFKAKYQV